MDRGTPSNLPDDRVEQGPPSHEPSGNSPAHEATSDGGAGDLPETVRLNLTATEPRIPLDAESNTTATLSHELDDYILRTGSEVTTKNETPDPAMDPQQR